METNIKALLSDSLKPNLSSCLPDSLDWGKAAFLALSTFLPHLVLSLLLFDIERLRLLALGHGIDITISMCKI
jgi:hypothetical protein